MFPTAFGQPDLAGWLASLAQSGAQHLAPNLFSMLSGAPERSLPNADLYAPGKMPGQEDPRIGAAGVELGELLSNFVGPGGGAKAAGAGILGGIAAKLPMSRAARLARMEEQGFRSGMPLYGSIAPEGEQIASAAVKVGDEVFTAPTHFWAFEKAEKQMGPEAVERLINKTPIPDGFLTTSGRYIGRHEAADIANATKQIMEVEQQRKGRFKGLVSEEIWPAAEIGPNPVSRTGATASGLPGGGGGVWLSTEKIPEASKLFHRTSHPISADAQGASLSEIHETLADAWSKGHDAVMLKNYTTPGGKTQNVVVVRDASQLRDPRAKFDPTKMNSRDIMAGIIPPAFLGAGFGEIFGGRQ